MAGFSKHGREWLANGMVSAFISVVTYQVRIGLRLRVRVRVRVSAFISVVTYQVRVRLRLRVRLRSSPTRLGLGRAPSSRSSPTRCTRT